MDEVQCAVSGVNQISLDEAKSMISNIEQASLELRLVEHEFYKDIIQGLKRRYRKTIAHIVAMCIIAAATWGLIYCILIHCPMLR